MVATDHRGEDRRLHLRPMVDHLSVTEAEDTISERAKHGVTSSVLLKFLRIGVVFSPIHFNDEPLVDHEIDSPYPGYGNLSANVKVERQ